MLGVAAARVARRAVLSRARPAFCGSRSMSEKKGAKIIYTITDEAPMLATYSLLPIIQRFVKPAGIVVETSDISVAARIITHFNDKLPANQQVLFLASRPKETKILGSSARRGAVAIPRVAKGLSPPGPPPS